MIQSKLKMITGFGAAILITSAQAQSLITSLGGLSYTDQINWGALGGNDTLLNSGFTVGSAGSLVSATVSDNGNFSIRVGEIGWNYAFGYGVNLLYDQSVGPVAIDFSAPVNGIGFSIDNNYYGYFNATIQAFDANNHSLVSVTETLNSSYVENSAGFIGLTARGVSSVVISTDGPGANDFAIGTIYLAAVPEPSTFALASLSGLALLFRKRK